MESALLKEVVAGFVCMTEKAFTYMTSFSLTEMKAL